LQELFAILSKKRAYGERLVFDMTFDFHTHSFYSDGVLSPIELIRRAHCAGYRAIAVTDHASSGNLESVIREVTKDCALAEKYWGIKAIAGVELTHVPAGYIDTCAKMAKNLGARIVLVHGETPVEPVEPGTNRAALSSDYVDILAHPGFITTEEALLAVEKGIYLEVTARGGHSLTNGHVVKVGLSVGAKFLVNSDSHTMGDLMASGFAAKVAQGAGMPVEAIEAVLVEHPLALLRKIGS